MMNVTYAQRFVFTHAANGNVFPAFLFIFMWRNLEFCLMVFSRCHGNNQLLVIQLNWTVFFLFPRGVCVCTSRKVAIYGILFVSKQFHRIFCELVLASIVHNKNHQWNYMSLHVPKLHNLVSVFFSHSYESSNEKWLYKDLWNTSNFVAFTIFLRTSEWYKQL